MQAAVRLLAPALAAACLLAAPAAALGAPAGVRVVACSPGEGRADGSVIFRTRMWRVPGTARMAIRIHLLEKRRGRRFERIDANGLGVWRKSRLYARGFRYLQEVKGLRRGAAYRARVDYRWYARDGSRIGAARRVSRRCRQRRALPNLRVAAVERQPAAIPGTERYRVTVMNRGSADAYGARVLLRVDGEAVDEAEVAERLAPGEAAVIAFTGPVCRRSAVAVVDPGGLVEESRENDNVHAASCV